MGKSIDDAKKIYGKYYDQLLNIETLVESDQSEDGKTLNEIINRTDRLVNQLGRHISTSQLRNIYAKIKGIKHPNQAIMLRPKLAYVAARQRNNDARVIPNFINEQLNLLVTEDDNKDKIRLKSLKTLVEMIVAYHKSHFN